MNRIWKVVLALGVTGLVVLYLEVISYVLKSRSWITFPEHFVDAKKVEPLRVLIVADPQIQGENDEPPFLGIFTRWDSDRYLQRTYGLAHWHVNPHVVVFLGDLFDEGSKAEDSQYRRYLQRFKTIFNLPKKQDPSEITYIFIPGDNDVGGEGAEEVSATKLKWFNQTVGDYKKTVSLQRAGWDVQFVKYHQFLSEYHTGPSYGLEDIIKSKAPSYRVFLSHVSMLNFISAPVQGVVDLLNPALILSAHDHRSTYYRLNRGPNNAIHTSVRRCFLRPCERDRKKSKRSSWAMEAQASNPNPEEEPLPVDQYLKFNMVSDGHTIHEISVPTCSYRMGTGDIGYGSLFMYPDGTSYYTVLWSPSRFYQLFAYLGVYILVKLIGTPWVLYKTCVFLYRKYSRYRQSQAKLQHSV